MEYWRIYNGFPVFWLALFSMAWYKSLYDVVAYVIAGPYEAPIWFLARVNVTRNLLESLSVCVYSCIVSEIEAFTVPGKV